MGCWNETCGFSQNTIRHGDKVYVVVILNNTFVGKSCYGDGTSKPMSLVMEAQYNDYGGVENVINNFAAQSTIKIFNEYLKENKLNLTDDFKKEMLRNQGDDYYNDGYDEETNEFTDVESIIYGIERGYISLNQSNYDGENKTHGLYFVLLSADVIESAWDTLNLSTEYETENDTWEVCKDDIQMLFDTFKPDQEVLTKEEIREALRADDITHEREEELYEMMFSSHGTDVWGGDKLKSKHLNWGNSLRVFNSYEGVHRDAFRKLYNIVKDSDLSADVNKALAMMLMTMKAYMAFRKSWAPQGHSSQHDSFDMVLNYTERMLRKLYKERQRRFEDGYYEDEGIPTVLGELPIFEEGVVKCTDS